MTTIRPYQPADDAACRACVVELQDSEREIDPRLRIGASMADDYLRQMHQRCLDHAGSIFVAVRDDQIIGLVMVLTRVPYEALDEPPGDYALVAELVVRAGFRSQGVGRTLLQVAEAYARESNASELRIGVLRSNFAARQLYFGEGFETYLEILSKPLANATAQ